MGKSVLKLWCLMVMLVPFFANATVVLVKNKSNQSGEKKSSAWHGTQALFGLILNTGNTDNKSINSQFTINYTGKRWSNISQWQAQYAYTRSAGKTQELYYGENQFNYNFNPKKTRYWFFNGNVTKNYFSAYDFQYVLSSGYGFSLFAKPRFTLGFQVGPGWRADHVKNSPNVQNRFIIATTTNVLITVSKIGSTLSEQLVYELGQPFRSYNFLKSTTAFTNKIVGNLAIQVSYVITHYSRLPTGSENQYLTDTNTNISLIYNFA